MLRLTRKKPLVAYVHVPKTAGSSINRALQSWGRGAEHVERHRAEPEEFLRVAEKSDWISGHIRAFQFAELLAPLDRDVRWFASVRDPHAHVASHYNWLIEIFHKGEKFYDGHNPQVKRISEQIRASDNSDPDQIIANLTRFRGLFLNLQTSYLTTDSKDATIDLGRFEYVCDDCDIDMLLGKIGAGRRGVPTENRSGYHFDKTVFEDPKIRKFLEKNNARDFETYRQVREGK